MSPAQRTMLFSLFARLMQERGIHGAAAQSEARHALTEKLFGKPVSWSVFDGAHVDRMKRALLAELSPLELKPSMELAQMQRHDHAQAAHVPRVQPGKRQYTLRSGPRVFASRYERETSVDHPGERKRLVWFIGRLFEPALIRHFSRSLNDRAEWEALPLPQLHALRDVLHNRLSKWLTKNKETYRFGFSTASRNPRSRTGILTNEEIITILLDRGQKVDMRVNNSRAAVEATEVEVPF